MTTGSDAAKRIEVGGHSLRVQTRVGLAWGGILEVHSVLTI